MVVKMLALEMEITLNGEEKVIICVKLSLPIILSIDKVSFCYGS